MVCSRKKYNKTRISKKKSNLKGGMKADFDEWQKTNMGRVFIHFNLLNVVKRRTSWCDIERNVDEL